MTGRVPDTKAHWRDAAMVLQAANPALYLEVCNFRFERWSGASVGYARRLSKLIVETIGNPHGYAEMTFVSSIKKAIVAHKREQRQRRANIRLVVDNTKEVTE